MASGPILARFQIKRDTQLNWTNSVVPLQSGEPGYDVENKILKIGDGNTLWNALQSISSSGGSGGVLQYEVNMTVTNVFQDSTINLKVIYSGVGGNGSIRLLRGATELYTENISLLDAFSSGTFAFTLPSVQLEHSTAYNIEVLNAAGVRIGFVDGYFYNPSVSLDITNVFVSSHQGIGITYTYSGPKINDMSVELRTPGNLTAENTMIIDISRSYTGTAESRTIYLMKTGTSMYNTGTFDLLMTNSDKSISANYNNFSYLRPTITEVYFNESDNKKLNISFNTDVILKQINFTIDPVTGSNVTSTIDFSSATARTNYPNNLAYSGVTYPVFRDSITTSVKFIDDSVLQYIPITLYSKQINAPTAIKVTSSASNNYTTLMLPNISFTGFTEVNITLYRVDSASSEPELAIYTIGNGDTGVSSSASGSPALTTYTTSATYNKAVTSGDIEYNKNYKLIFYNTDNVPLETVTFNTTGTITSFSTKKPALTANSATISSVSWSNLNAIPKPLNVTLLKTTDPSSPIGTATFNPTSTTITVLNSAVFDEGSTYEIRVQLPNNTNINSDESNVYTGTYVEPTFNTPSRISLEYLWFSTYSRIVFDIFTAASDSSTVGTIDVGSTLTINKSGNPTSGTTTINLANGLFVYDTYYIIKAVYSIAGSTPLTIWSNVIHYHENSASIANLQFPTPSDISGGTSTIAGLPVTENRYFTQIVEHEPSATPSSSTNSISLSDSSVFATPAIDTVQNSVGVGTISGTTFLRNNFYACRLYFNNPTLSSPVPVLLATCPSSVRFNPSDIEITSITVGASNTSLGFVLNIQGPQLAYNIQLYKGEDGGTPTVAATRSIGAGGGVATMISHDFQIEPSTRTPLSKYYLFVSMPMPPPYAAITSRSPSAANTFFNYTYDSTASATAITAVAVRRDSAGFFTGDGLDITVRWKGFDADGYVVLLNHTTFAPSRYLAVRHFNLETANTIYTWSGATFSNSARTTPADIPNGTYIVRMYMNNNNTATNDVFIEAPATLTFAQTSCTIGDISYVGTTLTVSLTWTGNSNSGISLVFRNPGVSGNIVSVNTLTTSTSSYTYTVGTLSAAINYSLVITLPSGATVSTSFRPVITTISVFSDIDSNTPTLGSRTVIVDAVTSVTTPNLQYVLTTTGTTSSGTPTTVFTSSNQAFNSASARQAPFVFHSSNFIIGHFYRATVNIIKSGAVIGSGTVNTANRLYNPAGYDILVFSGQSNMVGRDDGSSYASNTFYPNGIPRESTRPPLYRTENVPSSGTPTVLGETNNDLVDRNGNKVKSVQRVETDFTVGTIANYRAQQKTINNIDSLATGVTQAFDFTRLYADNIVSSTRRVGVVFAPRGAQAVGSFSVGGRNYTFIKDGIDRFQSYTTESGSTTFNCNRVVAFVWHQGEEDCRSNPNPATWAQSLHTIILGLANDEPDLFRLESLSAICGNIDLTYVAKNIMRYIPGDTTGNKWEYIVPNLIDSFGTNTNLTPAPTYKKGSYSSLGLLSIDPDSRIPSDMNEGPSSGTDVHLSARSERLMGLRAYNRYIDMNNIAPGRVPDLAGSTVREPGAMTFDGAGGYFSFASPTTSHENSVNPVAFLVTVSNTLTRPGTSGTTNNYFIYTESNSQSGIVGGAAATVRTCYIQYLPDEASLAGSSVTIPITSGAGASEIITNVTGIVDALTLNNEFNNKPSFSTGTAYRYGTGGGSGSITDKDLYGQLTTAIVPDSNSRRLIDFIEFNVAGASDTLKTANLAESRLTMSIQTIYTELANLNTGTKKFLLHRPIPFVAIIGQRILQIDESPSGTSGPQVISFSARWVTSPNLPQVVSPSGGSSSSHIVPATNEVVGNAGANIVVYAGCAGDECLKGSIFNGIQSTTTGGKTYKTVGIATTSTPVLNSAVFTPTQVGAWNFTGRTGLRYLYQYRGFDFSLFFSESQYSTSSDIPTGVYSPEPNKSTTDLLALQFTGVATEDGSTSRVTPTGDKLQTILKLPAPARFFTIYGTGCGFILKIRNMRAGQSYNINYYISTRSGRVPYGPNKNEAPYYTIFNNYVPFLTNALPVRVYTQSPILAAGPQPMQPELLGNAIGQDVWFDAPPTGVNEYVRVGSFVNQYLHSRDAPWDGSWRRIGFRVTMPALGSNAVIGADGTYSHNEVYLKFGPIPTIRRGVTPNNPPTEAQKEYINTSINIAAISIDIL